MSPASIRFHGSQTPSHIYSAYIIGMREPFHPQQSRKRCVIWKAFNLCIFIISTFVHLQTTIWGKPVDSVQ